MWDSRFITLEPHLILQNNLIIFLMGNTIVEFCKKLLVTVMELHCRSLRFIDTRLAARLHIDQENDVTQGYCF